MITLLSSFAFAGAFGIESGTLASTLSPQVLPSMPGAVLVTPPKPNAEFVNYMAIVNGRGEVCKVAGLGRDHEGDLDGSAVRSAFATLLAPLTERYGSPKMADFLHAGSIWKEPGEWTMSLFLKQRTYTAVWLHPAAPDMSAVALAAYGSNRSTTSLTLSYEFPCFDAYVDAQKKSGEAGL
jgi:hypothetical protein